MKGKKRVDKEGEKNKKIKIRTESEAAIGGVILDKLIHLLGGICAKGHGRDGVRVDEPHDLGRERERN